LICDIVQVNVKYTYSDLLTVPEDGNWYELFEGDLIITPSPVLLHQIASDNITYTLKQYHEVHDVFDSHMFPGLSFPVNDVWKL